MTVIAWDGKTLAADKQATNNGLKRRVTKIHRIEIPGIGVALAAFSGELAQGVLMLDWLKRGAKAEDFPTSQRAKEDWSPIIVITAEHGILTYEMSPVPARIEEKLYASGSGRDYAMAAMHLGCDAIKAVQVAIDLDAYCGCGIDSLTLD